MGRIILYVSVLMLGITPLLHSQVKGQEGAGQFLVCAELKTAYHHGRLVSNKLEAIADTIVCFLSGHVSDFSKQAVPFAKLVFTGKKTHSVYSCSTDMNGNFETIVPAGSYTMRSFYPFYESLKVDSLYFGLGDMRKLEIDIGENNCLRTKLTSDRKICDSLRALELDKD